MKPKLTNGRGESAGMLALAIYELLDTDIVCKAEHIQYVNNSANSKTQRFYECISLIYQRSAIKIIFQDYSCVVWGRSLKFESLKFESLKFEPALSISISSPDFDRLLNEAIKRLYTECEIGVLNG